MSTASKAGERGWEGPGYTAPDAEALADVVAVHPLLALGLAGRGPFGAIAMPRPVPLRGQRRFNPFDDTDDYPVIGSGNGPPARPERPLGAVPKGLDHILRADVARWLLVATLHPTERRLVDVIAFHGWVTRQLLLTETEGLPSGALDGLIRRLATMGVVEIEEDRVWLNDVVAGFVRSTMPSLVSRSDTINSARFDLACRLLGVEGGALKAERMAAVVGVLSNRTSLMAALGTVSPIARELFATILQHTLERGPVSMMELGIGYFSGVARPHIRPAHDPVHPLAELSERCLVGVDEMTQTAWAWAEVVLAMQGRLHGRWDVPDEPRPTACDDTGPASVRRLLAVADRVLDHFAAAPVEGKKGGDQRPPVKVVRSLAAAMSVDEDVVTLTLDLLIRLGLVRPVLNEVRRSRRASGPWVVWATDAEGRALWSARPMPERWLSIVLVWIAAVNLTEGQLAAATRRHALLAQLRSAPPGSGFAVEELRRWLRVRYPVHFGGGVEEFGVDIADDLAGGGDGPLDDLLAELVLLGFASGEGVIGMTGIGRAAAVDVASVAEAFGTTESGFTVQADHTVIAPPGLDPELTATLSSIAELESDAGAMVFRLSAPRLATAAQHRSADDIVAFLHDHSTVTVPSVVDRFVRDAAARARRLEVSDASSVLVADDPMSLLDALKVKTAKLTQVAPTVAVSSLAPARLRQVLAGKGVVTAGSETDAAAGVKAPTSSAAPVAYAPGAWAPDWVVSIPGSATPDIEVRPIGIGPEEIAAVVATGLT